MNDFSSMKANLYQVLKESGVNNFQFHQQILDLWEDVVGEMVSKHSRPDRIVNGILYIEVKNSSWINEISFLRTDIIDKYNLTLKQKYIKDIKFFLKKNDSQTNKPFFMPKNKTVKESERSITLKKLSSGEKQEIEDNIGDIDDEKLRKSLQKFLETSRKKQLALIEKGWKKCSRCNSLHQGKNSFCKFCKDE